MPEFLTTIMQGNSNKGLGLQEYNGEIGIVSIWEGREGNAMINWVYAQRSENGEKVAGKTMPLQIKLGDRKAAAGVLRQLLAALEGGTGTQASVSAPPPTERRPAQRPPVDDDIPF